MNWPSLVVGAFVGGIVGIVMQNILFPSFQRRWEERRQRTSYVKSNRAWLGLEQLHPRLALVQAGWGRDGCFPEGSIVLRREDAPFVLDPVLSGIRDVHARGWTAEGFTNGEQIGIAAISNTRLSDEHSDEIRGSAHRLTLTVHGYRYFDFLATHDLRLRGTEDERAVLDRLAQASGPEQPTPGFPTPCSVGLSVLCEGGTHLLLTRRSSSKGAGGYWEADNIFNPVGENAAPCDFAVGNLQAHESTPFEIARRGLYQEMGFFDEDLRASTLKLHSFAWASDLLDFKFFGFVDTPLSRSEVQDRWRNAPDRSETSGLELSVWPVRSADECAKLLSEMRDNPADWSPEAVFCSIRSLISLRRISADELSRMMRAH